MVAEMTEDKFDTVVLSSNSEKDSQSRFTELLKESPIPENELLANLGVYMTSKSLSRVLFFYEIYKKIVNNHGIICEFGVRWGQTLSILSALRGIFEPFNRHRKIVGFDTFEGFKGLTEKDGNSTNCSDGSFNVSNEYEKYLDEILHLQEQLNPINHLKKYELIKGDAVETVPEYFNHHPESLVSLAIFDFDIYKPTKAALEAVLPHLSKGSILVFDELCDDIFPGETLALREVLNINELKIQRLPMTARISYIEL
jgi:methyltransferase family protein